VSLFTLTDTKARKHLKRHVKPYGCTFPQCFKRFGSKNDWKRHESSQHTHQEVWKCNENDIDQPGERCNRIYHVKNNFLIHLSATHGVKDKAEQKERAGKCRVGHGGDSSFWCGFCELIVDGREAGRNGRFDHIDDHFSGRIKETKMDISDWKFGDWVPPDSSSSATAGAGSGGADDSREESAQPRRGRRVARSTSSRTTVSRRRKRQVEGDSASKARAKKRRPEAERLS